MQINYKNAHQKILRVLKNMKRNKINLSILIIALGLTQSKAQDTISETKENQRQNPTGYVALNAGLGTGIGNFGDKDIGGALSGYAVQFSTCAPFVNSYFGLAAKANYGIYTMTNQPFFAQQLDIIKRFGLDSTVKFNENISKSFNQKTILAGMFGTLPMLADERLNMDVRALFGPMLINRPSLYIDSIGGSNYTKRFRQENSKSISFAYDFGISLRYNLLANRKLCIMLSFDYLSSKVNFEVNSNSRYTDDSDNLQEGKHTERIKYSYASYDITAGIGYVW